ncbi:MAG: hypothetical protein ACI4J3_07845 [Oscillospiraceae bacterium]
MGGKYTDAQKKASMKYLSEKTDDIRIRVPKGTKERWRTHATEQGKSLTSLITDLVETDIEQHETNNTETSNDE